MSTEDNVFNIDTAKPHTSGPMICVGCGHEWIGVMLSGMVSIDCPKCHTGKGMRAGFVLPENGTPTFHCVMCDIGCYLFTILEDQSVMCANCGHIHENFFD